MNSNMNNTNVDGNTVTTEKSGLPTRWFFSRILCLLVALGVWLYVVNVTTQDFEKTFNLIDVKIEGWEELQETTNMSVVNLEESKVSITVKGLRSDIAKLTEKDFLAYIDISELEESGKHNLDVSVDLPSTVSLVSKYPETVTISIDENIEREIDIEIDVNEYIMDNIYEMGEPTSDVTKVKITGPSDVLNRVKAAKAYVNLGTVMTSTVIRTDVVLVDKAGNPIDLTYLTLDHLSVTVTVPVKMEKSVILVCDFLPGVHPSQYGSILIMPNTIKVKGDPKILNELDEVTVYTLGGSDQTLFAINFSSVVLPGGVEVIDPPKVIKIAAERVEGSSDPEDEEAAPAQSPESPVVSEN